MRAGKNRLWRPFTYDAPVAWRPYRKMRYARKILATPLLWSRTSAAISELWPAPPSLSPFQLRCLRTLTSSGLRPRASSAVSKPVPAPPPSPSAFQPRCQRILVSSAVSEPWSALPSPRPGRDPPSPGSGRDPPLRAQSQLRRFRAPAQLRHFRALSSSAVSYPWLGPPSSSPQKAPSPEPALVFEPRASSTVSEYSGTRVPIYILSYWTGPAPHAQRGGGAAAHLPPVPTPLVPFLLARLRTIGIVPTGVYTSTTNWSKWTNHSDEKSTSGGFKLLLNVYYSKLIPFLSNLLSIITFCKHKCSGTELTKSAVTCGTGGASVANVIE